MAKKGEKQVKKRSARGDGSGTGTGTGRKVASETASIGQQTSHIRNKFRRTEVFKQLKSQQKAVKKKARLKRQDEYRAQLDAYNRQKIRHKRERDNEGYDEDADVKENGVSRRKREETSLKKIGENSNGEGGYKYGRKDGSDDVIEDDEEVEEDYVNEAHDNDEYEGDYDDFDYESPPLEPPQKRQAITIESERIRDDEETAIVTAEQMASDEVVKMCAAGRQPKVMITSTRKPSAGMFAFIAELLSFFPKAAFFKRRDYQVKKVSHFRKNSCKMLE